MSPFLFQDTLGEFANHSYTHAREWLAMQVCGCVLHGCVISCHTLSLSSVHTVPYDWKFSWVQNCCKTDQIWISKIFVVLIFAVGKSGTCGLARGRAKS